MTRAEAVKRLKVYRDYLCKMSSWFDVNEVAKPFNMAIEALEQPAADVVPMKFHERCMELEIKKRANMVEVVRCKDCCYYRNGLMCMRFHELKIVDWDDYCSFAERKILPKP